AWGVPGPGLRRAQSWLGRRARPAVRRVREDPGLVSVLVSIHDVTPALAADVGRLWQLCIERRVTPALLVVPDWHGAWPLDGHPEFVGWLRARAAEGAEIVLHGERHDEAGLTRTVGDSLRAWGRTASEGEFLTLDAAGAGERIARGLRCLQGPG